MKPFPPVAFVRERHACATVIHGRFIVDRSRKTTLNGEYSLEINNRKIPKFAQRRS
jgi:hypothetical protein